MTVIFLDMTSCILAGCFEKSVNSYETTWRHIPQDYNIFRQRHDNQKSSREYKNVIYIHSNEIHNVAALIVYWCSGVSSTCFGP